MHRFMYVIDGSRRKLTMHFLDRILVGGDFGGCRLEVYLSAKQSG
jgi:hypothetical protein